MEYIVIRVLSNDIEEPLMEVLDRINGIQASRLTEDQIKALEELKLQDSFLWA